ncbi:MAG: hypothetical protein IPL78_01845 [Chloroflexi bacterium]|nr:hypothetical protein [Chloroflexota bacterium]
MQIWAVLVMLQELPVFLLRLSLWDIINVIAYIEASTLLESGLIWLVLVLVAAILPGWLFRSRLIPQATVILLLSSLWAVAFHFRLNAFWELSRPLQMAWIVTYFVSLVLAVYYLHQSKKVEGWLVAFVDRLEPLATLYLVLGVLGAVIVVVRNLF